MFTVKEVFSLPQIQDLTADSTLTQAFLVLKLYIDGEPLPDEALEDALPFLDQVEDVLLEHYIDAMRVKFYRDHGSKVQFDDLAKFADAMTMPPPPSILSPRATALIARSWTALVISTVNLSELCSEMTRYFAQHPPPSAEGLDLVEKLCALGLGAEVWAAIGELVPATIKAHVLEYTSWTASIIDDARKWLENEYMPVLGRATPITAELSARLHQILEQAVAELRISQISSLIINLPGSAPALDDLKLCIGSSALLRARLVQQFEVDQGRILNNGVPTVEIFLVYLKCIKAFSVLDSRGILLDRVSKPIRQYLKNRHDSVKILVGGLMGQDSSPLAFLSSELAQPHGRTVADLCDRNWMPAPTDTPVDYVARQISDTITTLLSLHDNKDTVIVQLNEEFAKQLLTSDQDLQPHLNNLKRRFGSRQLQNIDVMLHDVRNSRRLNALIHQTDKELHSVHAFILSKLYWPNINARSTLRLPQRLQGLLEQYKAAYTAHETDRKIEWLPNLGKVSITVELQDRKLDLVVTPDQAAVLGAFEAEPSTPAGARGLSLAALKETTGLDHTSVLAALRFWMHRGVLQSENELYSVLEVESTIVEDNVQVVETVPEAPSNSHDMDIYWSYIKHMLGNVGPLPADRIHSFLMMLVPKETGYTKTVQQLEQFLDAKAANDKLVCEDEKYILV